MAGSSDAVGLLSNRPFIVAVLFLATCLTGVSCLIGAGLLFIFRAGQHEDWEASHFAYQIRTFWVFVAAMLLVLPSIVLVLLGHDWAGWLLLPIFPAMIWAGIRSVLSMINAVQESPMAKPRSWLI